LTLPAHGGDCWGVTVQLMHVLPVRKSERDYDIIYMSPDGALNQKIANTAPVAEIASSCATFPGETNAFAFHYEKKSQPGVICSREEKLELR
jgi:hypothetical protein